MEIYAKSIEEIEKELKTDRERGLSEEEAKRRLSVYGPNEIPKAKQSFVKIYLAPLFNWLIVIYLIGALIMYFASLAEHKSDLTMIYITLGIVGINALVAIIQQARATKKLNALRELSAPTCKVIRNGEIIKILSKEVVVGDLLFIAQGDRIPADARIITSTNLEVNESSLTGESVSVRKNQGEPLPDKDIPLAERKNMVFLGTFVTMGTGKAIITATGPNTEIGKISKGLDEAATGEIPIREKMNNFGKWLGLIVMGLWFIILMILWVTTGQLNIVKSLNSAMDIMPINIPLLTTIILLTGVLAMAQHGVIIRNLASVDSLGRVSVVCTDKTGTLTKSQMSVQNVWTPLNIFSVSGTGYNPQGQFYRDTEKSEENREFTSKQLISNLNEFPDLTKIVLIGGINNNATLEKKVRKINNKTIEKWSVIGSPTEGSLVTLFEKAYGKEATEIRKQFEVLKEFPFDSSLKRMSKIVKPLTEKFNPIGFEKDSLFVFTKGGSEVIFPLCSHIISEEGLRDFNNKEEVLETVNSWAERGFRVLSLAYRSLSEEEYNKIVENDKEARKICENNLIYVGFVTILDPPREGVKEAVEQCHQAGVNVVMITGDSPATARAIAKQISIITSPSDLAIEGKDIARYKENEKLMDVKVFARVSPSNKEEIVKYYQNHKKVVAMTGDGVNDALALNLADAGIAMGIQGTDVAKEAADMVISDDSFNSIVTGIKEGRGIFQKIRVVVFFYIAINLFEGIVQFVLSVIFNLPYFLDEAFYAQWIFLSITVHVFPGLILTFDTISDDVMKEKPRDSEEILTKNVLILMLLYGILMAISMLGVYFIGINGIYPVFPGNTELGVHNADYLFTKETLYLTPGVNLNHAKTLTMLMATLFFMESALVLQIRRPNKSLWKSIKEDSNVGMYLVLIFLFAIFLSLMYIPKAQVAIVTSRVHINFMFMYLTPLDWFVAFLFSLIAIGGLEALKYYARKRNVIF